uniref:Uncharacterized protein n=1 Tax=Glossina brevipalpis TaxID=37001 RepID=A0A1A9W5I1_9MUSC
MSKKNDTSTKFTPTEFQFYAPKEKQSFAQLLYNSKDGTYLGRTPASWVKFNSPQLNLIQSGLIEFGSVEFDSIQFDSIQFDSIKLRSFQFDSDFITSKVNSYFFALSSLRQDHTMLLKLMYLRSLYRSFDMLDMVFMVKLIKVEISASALLELWFLLIFLPGYLGITCPRDSHTVIQTILCTAHFGYYA